MVTLPPELQQLAALCGVQTAYKDVYQKRQRASTEAVLSVLDALGIEIPSLADVPAVLAAQQSAALQRGIEPVLVAWDREPVELHLALPASASSSQITYSIAAEGDGRGFQQHLHLQEGAVGTSDCGRYLLFRLRLPGLEFGYYDLRIEAAGNEFQSLIISAPRKAYSGDDSAHSGWGCFLPLYALRSDRNWGAGDFTDLQQLGRWTADLGGRVVGTLPLLAAFLDEPCDPSPYAPASRLAWNEFYVDVQRVPEMSACDEAKQLVGSSDFAKQIDQLRSTEYVDYRALMVLKRRVLERLCETFFAEKPPQRYQQFEQFLRHHPYVGDYAEFRAVHEVRRQAWRSWPQPLRDGQLSGSDYDQRSKRYHLYAQWIATEQLESLADSSAGGLYLDLPLGVRSDGYDVWRWRSVYARDASAGSPPDAVWTKGQNWGFPPLHPEGIRRQGYRHVRDFVTHHLRLARMLRVDHVMQLHRLYWIPRGMGADQGCYVSYRAEEFYAILSLESHRCRSLLIGENLGTVPPEVNRAMHRHEVQKMYVVQYEIAGCEMARSDDTSAETEQGDAAPLVGLAQVPAGSLASVNTHDMASFAAWWRGLDLSLRQELGLLTEEAARGERQNLQIVRTELIKWLRQEGWLAQCESGEAQVLQAILDFLASSGAAAVLVNLEDLWLEPRPQNVPGTSTELPNWKRKAAIRAEDFMRRPEILAMLQSVDRLRKEREAHQARAHVPRRRGARPSDRSPSVSQEQTTNHKP